MSPVTLSCRANDLPVALDRAANRRLARSHAAASAPVTAWLLAGMRLDLRIAATWAHDRFRPAMFGQVQLASLFVREDPLEIADGHLSDPRLTPGLASHPRHSPTVNGA